MKSKTFSPAAGLRPFSVSISFTMSFILCAAVTNAVQKISPTHTISHFHFIRRKQKDFPGLDPGPHWAKPPDSLIYIASRYRTRISILCYKYILLLEDTDASAY